MKILALDLETTGLLDDEEATVTEVAYALWDTEFNRIMKSTSYLVDISWQKKTVPEAITKLTGITNEMLTDCAESHAEMVKDLLGEIESCDAVMARNAKFDRGFVEREFARLKVKMPVTPWICTKIDVEYPDSVTGRTQSHIAADHGFVNPFPHWAIGDVLTMLRIHDLGGYGWDEPFKMAQSPMVKAVAEVSFSEKDKAKDAGFQWNPEAKQWFKEIRAVKLDLESKEYDFPFYSEAL